MTVNIQKPIPRTRHMAMKTFALIDWIERDLLLMKRIATTDNYSAAITKTNGTSITLLAHGLHHNNIRKTYSFPHRSFAKSILYVPIFLNLNRATKPFLGLHRHIFQFEMAIAQFQISENYTANLCSLPKMTCR